MKKCSECHYRMYPLVTSDCPHIEVKWILDTSLIMNCAGGHQLEVHSADCGKSCKRSERERFLRQLNDG